MLFCNFDECVLIYVGLFCNPLDCNLLGSSVRGIFQARILKWVAISSSRGSSNPEVKPVSPASHTSVDGFFTPVPPRKPLRLWILEKIRAKDGMVLMQG